MTKYGELAAAILVGGRARRLNGVNKGTLVVGRSAIIDRQLDTLHQLTGDIFVVGRPDSAWTMRGLRVVPDAIGEAGPLGGIYTAIMQSPRERTLVVACDMPFLSAELLRQLADVKDSDLVIPRHSRGYEPLCAIYSRACARDIGDRLGRGMFEASRLPAGLRVTEFNVDDGTIFVNVNTPHDYERAREMSK